MSLNPSQDMQPTFSGAKGSTQCPVCTSDFRSLAKSPSNHTCVDSYGNENRACKEYWEGWISYEIEEKAHDDIRCMFCPAVLGRAEFKKLGVRKDTIHRYSQKQTDSTKRKCQKRCKVPDPKKDNELQDFNRETDGRVFMCKYCSFETCVDCDHPEHVSETCEEYQAKLQAHPTHKTAEAATYQAFKSCPKCHTLISIEKNCGYVQCAPGNDMSKEGVTGGCGHRFCSHCLINWDGDASAYLGGQAQHGTDKNGRPCKYATRATDSVHGLKHRFERGGDDEAEEPAAKKHKMGNK